MKIAVIGSGISGLSAAYFLSKKHKVDLFEKDDHFGGHSYTVDVEYEKNKKISVDVGFIVFNHQTYPNLINFFKENKIDIEKSNMSFSVSVKDTSIEYCGNGLNGIFANRKNLVNIKFLKMFLDIVNFYKKKDIIISLIISARINKEQGRMEICKNALIEALSIKTTEDTLDEEEQIFELLHQIYASDKNWEKAYYYHEKHSKTRNKIEKKRSSKELKGIHFKHQIKELESEKTLLYEQVKTKTKEVFDISRFPAENPNCIMRINNKGKVIYANVPAKTDFMTLFGIDLDEKVPKHISGFLDEVDKSKEQLINKIVEFGGRTFTVSIKKIEKNQSKVFSFLGFEEKSSVKAEDYYNIYAHEITKYQQEVNKRELALKRTMEAIEIKDNKTRKILDKKSLINFPKI